MCMVGRLYGAESLVLTGVVEGPVGGVPAVRSRFSRQRADNLSYGLSHGPNRLPREVCR